MPAQSKSSRSGTKTLEERLAQHPELKTKIESLLSVVENAAGDLTQADEAEQAVIGEIRALGQAALAGWAEQSHEATRDSFIQSHPKAHRSGKKNGCASADGALAQKTKQIRQALGTNEGNRSVGRQLLQLDMAA